MENDSIVFTDEDGNEVVFSVMEQTTLGGVNYLLVTEDGDDEDDGSFLILKENASDSEGEMAAFDIVEDDKELDKDSCIILAYLNSIGFDIVVLSPAGTAGLETYLDENYFTNIRLDRMKYDVKYSDMKYTAKKSKGFLAKLFG